MLGRGRITDATRPTQLPQPYSDAAAMNFYANNQPGYRQQFPTGHQGQHHPQSNGHPTTTYQSQPAVKAVHKAHPGQHHFEAEAERAYRGKKIILYRNGDVWDKGLVMSINGHEFANYATLITHLNHKQFLQRSPVNRIYTTGGQLIRELDELRDGQAYVAATSGFTQAHYGKYTPPEWNISRGQKKVDHKGLFDQDHKHPLEPPQTFRARPPPADILKPVGIVGKGSQPSRISNGSFPFNSTAPNSLRTATKPPSRVSDGSVGSLKNSPSYQPSLTDPTAVRRRAMSLTPPPQTHRQMEGHKSNIGGQQHRQGQQPQYGTNGTRIPVVTGSNRVSQNGPERWDQVEIGRANPKTPQSHPNDMYSRQNHRLPESQPDDSYNQYNKPAPKPSAYTSDRDRIVTPTQYKKPLQPAYNGDYNRLRSPSYSEPRQYGDQLEMAGRTNQHHPEAHLGRTGSLTELRPVDDYDNSYGGYDRPYEHDGYAEKHPPYTPRAGELQGKSDDYNNY